MPTDVPNDAGDAVAALSLDTAHRSFGGKTAYRSFGGEVEASSISTICGPSDSRRHQPPAMVLAVSEDWQMRLTNV
jgi:hypothetical protein